MSDSAIVAGLFVGKIKNLWPDKPPSAIAKQPVDGPLHIETNGFVEDQQADIAVHGGPEKAIHHYASEHMDFWRDTFPEAAAQFRAGCFGENISTTGLTEENLHLGDVLSLGSATVQVCQGRQPCWKLNAHTGLNKMAAQFQKTGFTGWYYRVLENGMVKVGDKMEVIERIHMDWSLQRLIHARFNPRLDTAIAAELAEFNALSKNWREAFAKKAVKGFSENTDKRLKGR